MGLRLRIFITITSVFVALIAATYVLFSSFLLEQFNRLEIKRASVNVQRVLEMLNATAEDLKNRVNDWGHWDESYSFIQGKNEDYIETNLNFEALVPFELAHIIYLDERLKIRHAISLDPEKEDVTKISKVALDQIVNDSVIANFLRHPAEDGLNGMVIVEDRPVFVSVTTITDNTMEQPARGFLIFTREFSEQLKESLAQRTKLEVSFEPATYAPVSSGESAIDVTIANDDKLVATGTITDLHGMAIINPQVTMSRETYHQGIYSRNYLMTMMLGFVLLANIVIYWLVEKFVINRIGFLSRQMTKIIATNDVDTSVELRGKDEISQLAKTFNHLMLVIKQTYIQLTEARNVAQSANDAKSAFIAKVSHELRTPIHSILGMQRIILKESKSKSINHFVRLAQDSTNGLMSTINEILDFSKIESGNLTLESIPFNVRDVARDTMRLMSGRLEAKPDLELLCDIHPDVPPELEGDPTRLKQIMVNLIGNSIKFTSKGSVTLRICNLGTLEDWKGIKVVISDTGIGIPQNKLTSIFEPFTQADETVTRNYQGTGLGLTIVKQLSEGMNGRVYVESVLGQGSDFIVELGLKIVGAPDYVIKTDLHPAKVTILAKSPGSIATLTGALDRFGIESNVITSADERGLNQLSQGFADSGLVVVFSEVLESHDTTNLIIEKSKNSTVPMVAVLRPSEISTRERFTSAGIQHLLTQPLFADDLFLSINGQLPSDDLGWEDTGESHLQLGKKLRILVADDAPTNRMILESMLQEAGHEVVCVSDGLRMFRTIEGMIQGTGNDGKFDIVLTDVQMPLLDGIEATRKIREAERVAGKNLHVPIIAVTAHAMKEQHDDMCAAGVDGVVTKPIEPHALAELLAKLTGSTMAAQAPAPAVAAAPVAKTAHDEGTIKEVAQRIWNEILGERARETVIIEAESAIDTVLVGQVMDIADLYNRSGQSARRTAMILRAFKESYEPELNKLAMAQVEENIDEMKRAAHTIKGLLYDIGCRSVGAVAGDIEAHCWGSRLAEGAALVPTLTSQTVVVGQLVEKLTAELTA